MMGKSYKLKPGKLLANEGVVKGLLLAVFYVLIFAILIVTSGPKKYKLNIGDIADQDIDAPSNMVDKIATEIKREEAEANVQPIYKLDLTIQIELSGKVDSFFNQLDELRQNHEFTMEEKIQYMVDNSIIDLDKDDYEILLMSNEKDIKQSREDVKYLINQILNQRINEEQIESKREEIRDFFSKLERKSKLNDIGAEMAVMILKPNIFYDEEETNLRRAEARENIEEILIKKGTRIVSKGQEVNSQQIELLRTYGLLEDYGGLNWKDKVPYAILILLFLSVLGLFIWRFSPKLWSSNSLLLFLGINIIITLLMAVGSRNISDYIMPIPAAALIISILVDPKAAMIVSVFMGFLAGFITEFNITVMIALILSGIVGSIIVSKTYHRSAVIYAGLGVALINIFAVVSFGLMDSIVPKTFIYDISYGVIGGIFTSVLTIGLLPFFETVFDIITPIKLMELSNPNQPLIRRLLIEAPGTYYHSILVGNLSEAAAEEVGANPLLCRVGSYYHDIGKLKRPYFFKENQLTKENPHDKISPNLSALVITSHVKDGLDIAKKYKLPSKVMDIIGQHHGDTLVAYFYHKAVEDQGADLVPEEKFRYQQKKPSSKEAGIVMLADSVEAYIRSLTEPTKDEVEKGVRKIVWDKINDGQLDDCGLTLKDIESIIQAFIKVLEGIFHDRIEYPENIKDI